MRPKNLETLMNQRIARKHGDVFLRADFRDLGGYDQVGRVLRLLVHKGKLLKIGHGLYARAKDSPSDGTPTPVKPFHVITLQALKRLGIEIAHGTGGSTRLISGRTIGVTKRVRRKIGYSGVFVEFEHDAPIPRRVPGVGAEDR